MIASRRSGFWVKLMEVEFAITPGFREGCRVLVLEGEVDITSATRLDEALEACADGFPVIADLSSLTFIDSAGLHILLKERPAGRLAAIVRARGSNVGRVLDIIDVDRTIPLYESVTAAIDAIGPDS